MGRQFWQLQPLDNQCAMAEMDGGVVRYFTIKRRIVRKIDLLVLEHRNAHDEFVLAQLAQLSGGLMLAFVGRNQVDEGILLVFNYFQVSDIGTVSHATHHHAFQSAETRHGGGLETEAFRHPHLDGVGVDTGLVFLAIVTQQFFLAFFAENHVIIGQWIGTVELSIAVVQNGVDGVVDKIHVGADFCISWDRVGQRLFDIFDFQAFSIFNDLNGGGVLFGDAFGIALIRKYMLPKGK